MNMLLEDNVRHLPHYAAKEIIEEIAMCISEAVRGEEGELLKEIAYLLNHSSHCRDLINELLT